MEVSSLKNNLPNFNNNNNEENENEHFSYNPKYQNEQNKGLSIDEERNPNDYSNISNAVKNNNRNEYPEENKDNNNFGNSQEEYYRNDSPQKRGTFGVNSSDVLGLGAYEKQNEINNESIYKNNNNNNNKESKKDLRYLQETQSSRNLKRVFSGLVEKSLTPVRKSLEEIDEDNLKKKNAAEKCFSLYENGKIKNEVNRLLAEKNQKIKQEMELKDCTFHPKTNFNDRFVGDKNVNNQMMKKLESNFYDRITSWQQKKEKK